jgi:hypothetical protein
MNWICDLECNGRIRYAVAKHFVNNSLKISQKACALSKGTIPGIQHIGRGGAIQSAEFNSTVEHIAYGCSQGLISVSKISSLELQMRDSWECAGALVPPLPLRRVRCGKNVEVVHWTLGNRNEIGVASKSSGDVLLYDLKCCGSLTSSVHIPAVTLCQRQGHGVGGILDFSVVDRSRLVIAGSQSGIVVTWDRRDCKKPKGTIRQSLGPVSFVQVLFLQFKVTVRP